MENHSKSIPARRMAREKQYQLMVYGVSVVLTLLAFLAVGSEAIQNRPALVSFIIILALLQVLFQLTYFMHLKDKGHKYPVGFLFYGGFATMVIVFGILLWIWW